MAGVEASGLVRALEQVWAGIQRHHREVPLVVVTLGAGSVGVPRGVLKLGHFAADRWTPGGSDSAAVAELFVGGEGLAQLAESVLATLFMRRPTAWPRFARSKTRHAKGATTTPASRPSARSWA